MKIGNYRIKIITVLLVVYSVYCFSQEKLEKQQFNFSGGLGIQIFNSTNFTDYLNSLSMKRFDDFIINPEFFVSLGGRIAQNYLLNIDYTYIINSFIAESFSGGIENHLNIHLPALILYRDFYSNGGIVKIGAGLSYSYAILGRRIFNTQMENFYSNGAGFKFALELNTPFGDNFYGLISSNINILLMSNFKNDSGEKLSFRYGNKNKDLDLDFFSLNLRFGIIYYL